MQPIAFCQYSLLQNQFARNFQVQHVVFYENLLIWSMIAVLYIRLAMLVLLGNLFCNASKWQYLLQSMWMQNVFVTFHLLKISSQNNAQGYKLIHILFYSLLFLQNTMVRSIWLKSINVVHIMQQKVAWLFAVLFAKLVVLQMLFFLK